VIILDSSAVLAMLQDEPGADRVVAALASDSVAISAANLAEVLSILAVRGGVAPEEARATVEELDIRVVPVTDEIATSSAEIAMRHPRSGLSLGDRLCIATGIVHGCTVLTTDQAWLGLELGVEIESIKSGAK
jgi:ribonuclease VapC